MISTVGNPNFASAILAILATLSFFGMFIKGIPNLYKLIALVVVFMALLAIIRSESRQGLLIVFFSSNWIGYSASFLILFFASTFWNVTKRPTS